MSDEDDFLAEAFRRQLASVITTEAIRRAERGEGTADLWRELDASGFADAMLPEEQGGAGIGLAQAFPLILAAGEACVPLPFAETLVARGLLTTHGVAPPSGGAIVFGGASPVIPGARFASHALVPSAGGLHLVLSSPLGDDLFGTGGATGVAPGEVVASLPGDPETVILAAAAVAAGLMAGAMGRVMEMSLRHAGERQQFGRSLGKFQAIQQQLAVLAEQVISAQVAARTAFFGAGFDPARVAAAKCRANEAATVVCNIAHAVHGAIGATAEFDLQLYTRRIKQWQLAYGSDSHWAARLGRSRLESRAPLTSDFLRLRLGAEVA